MQAHLDRSGSDPATPAQAYEAFCKRHRAHCNSLLKETLRRDAAEAIGKSGTSAIPSSSPSSSFRNETVAASSSSSSSSSSLSSVKHLDFSNNFFGRNGIIPVLEAVLPFCPNLESLNLSKNYISNESVAVLFELLKPRTTSNQLTELTGNSSFEAQLCPRLQYLDLSSNPISCHSGKLISRLVDALPHLRNVQLDGTLMNRGLQSVIATKCAKKSPRFDGLRALSLVVGEVRPLNITAAAPTAAIQPSSSSVSVDTKSSGASGPRRSSSPVGIKRPGMIPPTLVGLDAAVLSNVIQQHPHEDIAVNHRDHAAAEWTAMETIWNLATVAAPPQDGWTGLAAVMALVRQDATIASMY